MIIWANLDCEARWGGTTLPRRVQKRISAASVLLAAFAPAGEPVEIYAPAPVDPARVRIDGVTMRVGVPDRFDLAWADPTAKAANDRRFALAIGAELGFALPGARAVTSLTELDAHLASFGDRAWVCKAPWTAAGRDRAYGRGALIPDTERPGFTPGRGNELRVYVGRMLDRFGAVMFEPWCERIVDVGWCVGAERFAPHTLISDARGGFLGIDLAKPALTDDDFARLETALGAAGSALQRIGYAGPYTLDAFAYREGGAHALHALCELNARHTFGHVAHALRARFATTRLGFGSPPAGARVLVAPSDDDPVSAWVA